jgi:7-carboxy-7-deazaguanine synthase
MTTEGKYPIYEIFGPTRQGEGPQAGLQCYFVRFRGCGFDCEWCDTKYAVAARYPGWDNWIGMLTAHEVAERLKDKGAEPGDVIILSGGDPSLFVDAMFADVLARQEGFSLSMETQGVNDIPSGVSVWLNCLVVSPKPPSSGMSARFKLNTVLDLIRYRGYPPSKTTAIKFVAFDEIDLGWIYTTYLRIDNSGFAKNVEWYISVGTPLKVPLETGEPLTDVRLAICNNMAELWEMTLRDPQKRWAKFKFMPQAHALVWGQKAGV